MTAKKPIRFREDYTTSTHYDVKEYLSAWTGDALKNRPLSRDIVTDLHDVFQKVQIGGVRQLDFGCGPTIMSVLSSSRHCSHIIMAEYSEINRNEVTKWLDRDPEAYDWKPAMEYIATMEGNNVTWEDVDRRVRRSIIDVVPCDILKDEPVSLSADFHGSFDLLTSSLCLEAGCPDKESYVDGHKKLARFLKDGGMLVLDGVLGNEWYNIGDETFFELCLSKDDINEALTQAGYGPATWYIHQSDPVNPDTSDCKIKSETLGWFVLYAKKK